MSNENTRPQGILNQAELEALKERAPGMPTGYMARTVSWAGSYGEGTLWVSHSDAAFGQLYAALAVLSWDMTNSGLAPPSSTFERMVESVSEEERQLHGEAGFPAFGNGLAAAATTLPAGLAEAAASGNFNVDPLLDRAILQEWTFKSGKRLFETWLAGNLGMLRQEICPPSGLGTRYESEADLLIPVAKQIFESFGSEPFWGSLASILAVLVVRSMSRICA